MFPTIQLQILSSFQILNKMKKYFKRFFAFVSVSFIFFGCTAGNEQNDTQEIVMEEKTDSKCEYDNIDGVYILSKMYENSNGSMKDFDGSVEDISSTDSTDLPDDQLGEYNNFEIVSIDDKHVVLLNNIHESIDGVNLKTNWKFTCEITKGSKADFDLGETIEARSVDDSEYDKAVEIVMKGVVVKSIVGADPYQSSIKFNSYNHNFKISKNKIIETSNSNSNASIRVLKEVRE